MVSLGVYLTTGVTDIYSSTDDTYLQYDGREDEIEIFRITPKDKEEDNIVERLAWYQKGYVLKMIFAEVPA